MIPGYMKTSGPNIYQQIQDLYQQILDDFREITRETFREELSKINFDRTIDSTKIEYGTRDEVAKVLRISLPTLNDYSKRGLLNVYHIGGRILYRWSEVHAAVKKIENQKYLRAE